MEALSVMDYKKPLIVMVDLALMPKSHIKILTRSLEDRGFEGIVIQYYARESTDPVKVIDLSHLPALELESIRQLVDECSKTGV